MSLTIMFRIQSHLKPFQLLKSLYLFTEQACSAELLRQLSSFESRFLYKINKKARCPSSSNNPRARTKKIRKKFIRSCRGLTCFLSPVEQRRGSSGSGGRKLVSLTVRQRKLLQANCWLLIRGEPRSPGSPAWCIQSV